MKRQLFAYICIITLSCASVAAYAQKKSAKKEPNPFYLRAGLGYQLPTSAQREAYAYPLNGNVVYDASGMTSYEYKKASFASGLLGNVAIGKMLNSNIGIELNNAVGLVPVKYTGRAEYPDNGYDVKEAYTKHASASVFTIPTLVLQYGNKVKLYTRTGVIIPIVSRMNTAISQQQTFNGVTQTITAAEVVKHKFNLGLSTSVGVIGTIGKGLQLWAELNYFSLTLHTKEKELVAYSVNGVNLINRVTNPKLRYAQSGAASAARPTITDPYSSAGVRVGISLNL